MTKKKLCPQCKGTGGLFLMIQNLGTRDNEDHWVPCNLYSCENGEISPKRMDDYYKSFGIRN